MQRKDEDKAQRGNRKNGTDLTNDARDTSALRGRESRDERGLEGPRLWRAEQREQSGGRGRARMENGDGGHAREIEKGHASQTRLCLVA